MDDDLIRMAAFTWLKEQVDVYGEILDWSDLANGFMFKDQRIHLAGQSGIWKPQMMQLPISITTKFGGPYPDKLNKDGLIEYKYRGENPNFWDNVGLREAMRLKKPLIYLFGVSRGRYFVSFPVYIIHDDPANLTFSVQVDEIAALNDTLVVEDPNTLMFRRAYATTSAKIRLHQQSFRERVLKAYRNQCTLCRLRHPELLDAAHIIGDNEDYGDPVIQNGLSMCKIHHAAFDKNIIGINPDYYIHVRKDILEETDGPMLKYGLQSLENQKIILPGHHKDYPDQTRLEQRFDQFLKAG
jgi:putative restriction endonuclease